MPSGLPIQMLSSLVRVNEVTAFESAGRICWKLRPSYCTNPLRASSKNPEANQSVPSGAARAAPPLPVGLPAGEFGEIKPSAMLKCAKLPGSYREIPPVRVPDQIAPSDVPV